ncbi:cytochrome P450 CYP82J17-like [Pyrus communis]|uniref:cytochrome P450 CYP82J17-like n=1 Tax=Pyrus communis TaxID=23211 RepID=UPI0035C1AFFE
MDFPSHLLAIAGILLFVLYLWRVKIQSRKTKGMLAPQPSGALPVIGHLHKLGGKKPLCRTLASMADKYGPIFTIRLGKHPALVISNYDAVKECFTKNDIAFASRSKSAQGRYLGYNYAGFGFAPYGTYWRNMRKMVIVELLSSRRLQTLKHVQICEVDSFIKGLYEICKTKGENGQSKVVISEWIEHLTLNVITQMIAGKRYFDWGKVGNDSDNEGENKRIREMVKEFMCVAGKPAVSDVIGFPHWIDLMGQVKNMKRIGKDFDSLMASWIEEHKNARKEIDSRDKLDFIDVMLSVIEDNTVLGRTRETIIKATSQTLILAGSDTTATSLTWILSLLLNNRHVLKHAQEEINLQVGTERWVEDTDIKDLTYLQAIVKETLRLYPPAPLSTSHEAMEDCQVCGFYIPKGTRLFTNLWKLHRNPSVWSDPEVFCPDRFLTTQASTDVSGQHFEFIPFGSGRRSCPGLTFAMQVIHLTLGRLIQGFELATPLDMPVDMAEGLGVTMPKATSLEVVLTPRLPCQFYER